MICTCPTHINNLSLAMGVAHDKWKTVKVVPLFKPGKKEEMDNYMSTLPAVSKIDEKAVYHQVYQCLDQNGLLSPVSADTAASFFVDSIRRNMDSGLLTRAVYIDLKKASYN